MSDSDKVAVLTDPLVLTKAQNEKLRPLLDAIVANMSLHKKHDIVAELVALGLDKTRATLLVDKMIEVVPTVSYTHAQKFVP